MSFFKRYFTPQEANRTLPLVKEIVKDILDKGFEARSLVLMLGDDAEDDPEVQALVNQIQDYIGELEKLGCYFKDWNFSMGLVDFPAIIDGKEVFLCWRSDEEEIRYYHTLDAGYAGRKLIPEAYFAGQV